MPLFRTLADEPTTTPSAELLDTINIMQLRQEWLHDYLSDQGQDPLQFVGCARATDEPAAVAHQIRRALDLIEGWAARHGTWTDALDELMSRIESVGIVLVATSIVGSNTRRRLDVSEFRGFVMIDTLAPLIFVNGADAKAAQMFTLAHELAHVWLGSSAAFDLRTLQPAKNETERMCDAIAAEFLVPASELIEMWPRVREKCDRLELVAREFKVSGLVAARRALDLSLVTRQEFVEFYEGYIRQDRRRAAVRSGGNFYAAQTRRLGRRFAHAVVHAAAEGAISYREAYRLTGLYGATFERYATRVIHEGL